MMTTSARQHFGHCIQPDLVPWKGRRGDFMQVCRSCKKSSLLESVARPQQRADQSPPPETPRTGRYWLGCFSCGASIWLASKKPRIPLCARCTSSRRRKDQYAT